MDNNGLDERFRKEGLDALKALRHTEFTVEFMSRHGLPTSKFLWKMWADLETWLNKGDDSRCLALLEYLDNLKMWGKQRVFLYEIKGDRDELIAKLSDPAEIKNLTGNLYDNAVYQWAAPKPFLAHVKHTRDSYTNAPLLFFKFIEMRDYQLVINKLQQTFEERSTNFFIVNLRDGFAELRLQRLPIHASRNLRDEHELLEAEIGKYLDIDWFEPIQLEPIMGEMLRKRIYKIKRFTAKGGKSASTKVPLLTKILPGLFRYPTLGQISAYWECDQGILGNPRKLHFTLYGRSDSIAFNGRADPRRVQDILNKMVAIHNELGEKSKESIWKRGSVDNLYRRNEGNRRAQAAVLTAGVIAASIIWIVINAIGDYVLENFQERVFHGIPLEAITVFLEIIWFWYYYGSKRIKRSFEEFRRMKWSEMLKAILKARKRKTNDFHKKD